MAPQRIGRSLVRVGVAALLMLAGCTTSMNSPGAPASLTRPPSSSAPIAAAAPLPPEDLRSVVRRQEDENALLHEHLAQRDEQIGVLQQEVGRLQERTEQIQATIARLRAAAGTGKAESGGSAATDSSALAAAQAELGATRRQLADSRSQLANEQQRRASVETELKQLKQETSTAPLAAPPGTPAEADALAKAHSEIDELRKRLDAERAEREKTTAQLAALQANRPAPPANAPPPDAELQQRLADLQARQQEIVAGAQRDIEASRKREETLQSQLAAAQQEVARLRTGAAHAAAPAGAMGEAQAENEKLRKGIDEVERSNRLLSAKLKAATRVADLIFKMRAGQDVGVPVEERRAQLRQRVEAWRAAWSSGNPEAYAAFYAPDFVDDKGRSRAAWAARKRSIFERSGKIDVEVRKLTVDFAGDLGETAFVQSYASALERSHCRKTLTWRQQHGVWLIVGETVTAEVIRPPAGSPGIAD